MSERMSDPSQVFVLISGKRKSGKDYVATLLKERFEQFGESGSTVIVGLSHSLKKEFSALRGEQQCLSVAFENWPCCSKVVRYDYGRDGSSLQT